MRRLRLTREPLFDSHVLQLASWLSSKQCSLIELDLTYAQTSDLGATKLARALTANKSLTELNLAHNGIATRGGMAIADALKLNCTLIVVGLSANLLNDAAIVGLAGSLSSSKTLMKLDLGRNPLGPIGAQAVRQALHTNQSLTSLGDLASLPIAIGLRSSLEWYLRQNSSRIEALQLEAERSATQRDGLLKLLPPEERALRRKIFLLEDESVQLKTDQKRQNLETEQVSTLLAETIKRNAQLVDTVATLQGQVDKLRKGAATKKVAAKRGAVRRAAKQLTNAQRQTTAQHQRAGVNGHGADGVGYRGYCDNYGSSGGGGSVKGGRGGAGGREGRGGRGRGVGRGAWPTGAPAPAWAQKELGQWRDGNEHGQWRDAEGNEDSGDGGGYSGADDGEGEDGDDFLLQAPPSSAEASDYASGFASGYASGFESNFAPDVTGGFQRWSEDGGFEGYAIGDGMAPELTLSPRSLARARAQAQAGSFDVDPAGQAAAAAAPAGTADRGMEERARAEMEERARETLMRQSSELGLEDHYGDVM